MDIEDLLSMATAPRRTVAICVRGDLVIRAEDLRTRWQAAVDYDRDHNTPSTAPVLWDQLAEVEHEAKAATVDFTVQAISSTVWRRLVAEHPPPRDEGWLWDPETFPVAALAACCVEPAMTEDHAGELADKLSNGQWQKLFTAVMTVNVGDDLVPFFATATDDPPATEPNSTTAPATESLTASSSVNA